MIEHIIDDKLLKGELWSSLEELFPIYRTLMGEGYRASLDKISKHLPLNVLKFKSGNKCGSWTIPKEWRANEATVSTVDGKKIVDFHENSFQLCQYSQPFTGRVSKSELLEHVHVGSTDENAVPLDVAYYRNNWGLCLSQKQVEQLADDEYDVNIDTEFYDGELTVGEVFLPGKSSKTILIDAVLSCPSLGNNLSGVVIAVHLMKLLSRKKDRQYSYRLLLTPETLGPIALFHLDRDRLNNVVGGYTLVNLADRSKTFNYRKSRFGNTVADIAMMHALKYHGVSFCNEEFDVKTGTAGNEKAYNSLGIEVPVGSIRRYHLGAYPEYDTSLDDLSFVSKDSLLDSFKLVWEAIQVIERTKVYNHKFEGEPFLTGYGLFPKIANNNDRLPWDYLMGFADGENTLVEIAEKADLPIWRFDEPVLKMLEHGLIEEV